MIHRSSKPAEAWSQSGPHDEFLELCAASISAELSLIFYAYDLDQETELKRASTFQGWGRRGPDRQQAIDLGIFFEDNATRERWILKCDDPKTLAQIDAVFVTVEPKGGSHKPTSKTLLFASLKIDPNHP